MTSRPIRQGDIFWLDDCEPLHGDVAKRRPVVVVSSDAALEVSPNAVVVACTSSALPRVSDRAAQPRADAPAKTGLSRRTWAVVTWLLPVEKRLLVDRIGYISGATLRKLLEAVLKVQGRLP